MYSPRYREEPSIGTCEEDRVLLKLTELNVNKYASTDHLVSCYIITAYVTWDHDQYSSALAEHRSAQCGWFPNMYQFSSFCFREYRVRLYSLCFNKGEFQHYFEGFYMCFTDLSRTTCALGRN